MTVIEDIVSQIMPLVVRLVATVAVVLLTRYAIPAVEAYAGAKRMEAIQLLAHEAYAFVEARAPELPIKGRQKLEMALAYLSARLAERRMTMTAEQMRAVIESVWLEYNRPPGT